MIYMLPCSCSDQDADTQIDLAVVDLDQPLSELLLRYRGIFSRAEADLAQINRLGGNFLSMVFPSYEAVYRSWYSADGALDYPEGSLQDQLDTALADHTILTADAEEFNELVLPSNRTEGDKIHVNSEGVYWTCRPRHWDGVTITTETIPWATIEEKANA